ncbi:head GIN domain-containing protein [Flavobacterium sp. '19STA2R22 D10 B1']|uniref:head GIN domain-containing protein n=1 Tax=Flavobacterium aerium TaxID=3037261 RepID=UPI00278BCA41|nr:head GIN domain-containing protein [Flavobacterium sp. '19STA2R22 D10 B1']
MKKFMMFAFLVVAQISVAQSPVTKEVGEFNQLNVFDRISVQLIPSKENKIEIVGARAKEVELVNKNGKLKVRLPLKKLLKGEEITAKLYFKSIDVIEASEGSYVSSEKTFSGVSFEINAKEGAEINIQLDVEKATVRATTGGIVKLTGKATNQDVVINTGGILQAKTLITKQTAVSINAGGEADVNATDIVDAKVRAGGNITVYGDPKQINKKHVIGGSIKKAGE